MVRIYKLLGAEDWAAAKAAGSFSGAGVDIADGYIHFSTAKQAQETARRYFANRSDLVLFAVDGDKLGDKIRWEPSRGGDLFPHLYEPLPIELASDVRTLSLGADGVPDLGELLE
eukprot:TRINITY_DN3221_c0_g1_i1.p4 TRINITY_DN3221_c0_g1~~TRINITY_DN3221_c0_g1_i1.p4  ORF type:complete len:115 (+),score=50.22 TRINITY_DN3221_c0_g1_i1:707-1051(+)